MILGLKSMILIFVTVLALGTAFVCLAQIVPVSGVIPCELVKTQGAVFLWRNYFDFPSEARDRQDLDSPGDKDGSEKPARRNRNRNRNRSCGPDDYRRLELLQPCGKAWSG